MAFGISEKMLSHKTYEKYKKESTTTNHKIKKTESKENKSAYVSRWANNALNILKALLVTYRNYAVSANG